MVVIISKYKIVRRNLIIVFLISILSIGCTKQIEPGSIDTKNIKSFKIHNMMNEEKEIVNKSDRETIINLINSVKITNSNIEQRDGVGYGVKIVYSNGQIFSASFLDSTIAYTNNRKTNWCEIDKNILSDLKKYYNKK